MAGLAARGGASVQDPRFRTQGQAIQQQGSRALGRRVLHREPSLRIAWHARNRYRPLQVYGCWCNGLRGHAGQRQRICKSRQTGLAQVHPQGERGLGIGGLQNRLPALRLLSLQALNPPHGVIPPRLRQCIRLGHQLGAFAQKAAQAGVHKSRLPGCSGIALDSLNRLVHQREFIVGRATRIPAQSQGHAQQGIDCSGRCLGSQSIAQCHSPTQVAPHGKGQGLHARAQNRVHGFQRHAAGLPRALRPQHGSGRLQLPPQRGLASCPRRGSFRNRQRLQKG